MAEKLTGINGSIIRWARESYNISPDEAAEGLSIDTDRYLSWEEGEDYPTYAMLKRISAFYHKPTAVFFFPVPPNIPSIKGDLRTLSSEVINSFSKNIIIQFEKAKVYQISLHELFGDKHSIISERKSFPKDEKQLCEYFRGRLEFPISVQKERKNPKIVFEILRGKLYDLGIYVFKDAFKDDRVSGLCVNDQHFPIIIINNSMSFTRQIFTLFHELYHLISDTSGVEIIRDDYYGDLDERQKTIEHACDSFANSFLVPIDDFVKELNKKSFGEERVEELAWIYSVSKEAIMYKLYKMGRITSEEYNELKEIFYGDAIRNKEGNNNDNKNGGGNHYYTHLSYLGQQYTGDVFKHYFAGKIDSIRASEMLQSKVDHLPKLESVFFRGTGR